MVTKLYALRDDASDSFLNPASFPTDEAAMRDLAMMVSSSPSSTLAFAPGDYRLFRVGSFDSSTGLITPTVPAVLICTASSLLPSPASGDAHGAG